MTKSAPGGALLRKTLEPRLEQVSYTGAFFFQLIQGQRHALTAEFVDFQALHNLVIAIFAYYREAVHDAFRNAVAAIGHDAHGDPFAIGAEPPVMDVIDGGV